MLSQTSVKCIPYFQYVHCDAIFANIGSARRHGLFLDTFRLCETKVLWKSGLAWVEITSIFSLHRFFLKKGLVFEFGIWQCTQYSPLLSSPLILSFLSILLTPSEERGERSSTLHAVMRVIIMLNYIRLLGSHLASELKCCLTCTQATSLGT